MPAAANFFDRLRTVLVPTAGQALGSIFMSLLLLTLAQSQAVLTRLGITATALNATEAEFHQRFDAVLRSGAASQLALITFWAMVGLVAYLICWGVYNVLIEARNEITLTTAYTNRADRSNKHWRGALETLALKTVAALGLAVIISSLWYGLSFWIGLSAQLLHQPSLGTAATSIGAVIGFAIQLYFVLVFIQLTFTPWYRAETFTDATI
jgi:hypothetical protein